MITLLIIFLMFYKIELKFGKNKFFDDTLQITYTNKLRGISIILILLTHLSNRLNKNEKNIFFFYFDKGALYVGLFYFYSGYGLMKSIIHKPNYLNYFFKNRMTSIYIPFLCFNCLQNTIYIIFGNDVFPVSQKNQPLNPNNISFFNIIRCYLGFFLINESLWYIQSIIIYYLIFYFCFRLSGINYLLGLLYILIVYLFIIILNIQRRDLWGLGYFFSGRQWYKSMYSFPFGILIGIYDIKLIDWLKKQYNFYIILIFSILTQKYTSDKFNYFCSKNAEHKNGFIGILYFIIVIFLGNISIISFIISLHCVVMKVKIFNNKIMDFFGNISYEIYMTHTFFIFFYVSLKIQLKSKRNLQFILVILSTIITSCIFNFLFNKITKYVKNNLCCCEQNVQNIIDNTISDNVSNIHNKDNQKIQVEIS